MHTSNLSISILITTMFIKILIGGYTFIFLGLSSKAGAEKSVTRKAICFVVKIILSGRAKLYQRIYTSQIFVWCWLVYVFTESLDNSRFALQHSLSKTLFPELALMNGLWWRALWSWHRQDICGETIENYVFACLKLLCFVCRYSLIIFILTTKCSEEC